MRTRTLMIAILLLIIITSVQGQQEQHSVLLPASEAIQIGCNISWQPTKVDIEALEANLPHIANLQARGWKQAQHIDHPEKYFRQNVACVASGKRNIFVNAFCNSPSSPYWRSRLIFTKDGGSCYWHVTYDSATKKFSGLEINGIG